MACPRVQSCSSKAHTMAKIRSLVGLACSIYNLLMVLAVVTPNLNPLPSHLDGTSSQTTKYGAPLDPEHTKLRVPAAPHSSVPFL